MWDTGDCLVLNFCFNLLKSVFRFALEASSVGKVVLAVTGSILDMGYFGPSPFFPLGTLWFAMFGDRTMTMISSQELGPSEVGCSGSLTMIIQLLDRDPGHQATIMYCHCHDSVRSTEVLQFKSAENLL